VVVADHPVSLVVLPRGTGWDQPVFAGSAGAAGGQT
jgi:hypothetical protein